ADRGSGTKEISQSSAGHAEFARAGNRLRYGTIWIRANVCDVSRLRLCGRYGKRHNIGHEIRAGIVAVVYIEELDEWGYIPALSQCNRSAHAQICLHEWRPSK